MITFGGVPLNIKNETLNCSPVTIRNYRHYPGTDINDSFDDGKDCYIISCTLIAESMSERILYEQLTQDPTKRELIIDSIKWKQVNTDGKPSIRPADISLQKWLIDVVFKAHNPTLYDVTTGGALY